MYAWFGGGGSCSGIVAFLLKAFDESYSETKTTNFEADGWMDGRAFVAGAANRPQMSTQVRRPGPSGKLRLRGLLARLLRRLARLLMDGPCLSQEQHGDGGVTNE